MSADTIQTSVGEVPVLHRLELGIVVRDAVTERTVASQLRVGWEAPDHLLPRRASDQWPCFDFEPAGAGRFRLRSAHRRPAQLTVRIDDPSRRYTPRRLGVPLWSPDELAARPPANPIAVGSRTLPIWLWPGATYPGSAGTTAIRGRVARRGEGIPWARVTAVGTGAGLTLGRAHGDDRGEFLLCLTDVAQNPVQSTVDVRLLVRGPTGTPKLPPIEAVTRSANPPMASDLDNDLLRGVTPPAEHVLSIPPPQQFTVNVGRELVISDDIPFNP